MKYPNLCDSTRQIATFFKNLIKLTQRNYEIPNATKTINGLNYP
ncbi:hypothetical protein SAMN05421766_102696 [Zobellia uliginosa]|uniref:Uncharacterized protein n=1 Tax=Zobellia uliginosa TaxID=143224 RepID=A0ABY1KNW5_9FLAO|nr:hypothetical protein SAMN05421766_102696 [Zobellia uliginosa]